MISTVGRVRGSSGHSVVHGERSKLEHTLQSALTVSHGTKPDRVLGAPTGPQEW